MITLLPILVIASLVLVNGLFVAAEFAIIGVRPSRIEQLAREGSRPARWVHSILSNPSRTDRYVATAQLGITLASLGLGMYGEPHLAGPIEGRLHAWFRLESGATHTIAFLLALTIITYLHVVFGEMVPKSIALQGAERTVLALAPVMSIASRVLFAPIKVLNHTGGQLLRLLRIPLPAKGSRLYSPDELELIVTDSYAGGLLEKREQELVANIFNFAARRAVQVMTPRTLMQVIPLDIGEDALMTLILESAFSRLPVQGESIDDIVGVLHLKDFVRQRISSQPYDLSALLRPAVVVPETVAVDAVLAAFKRHHQHLAIVIDEHGGTLGLVTLEDLIEEVVGEVRDEFDTTETPPIQVVAPGHIIAQGTVVLDDLMQYAELGQIEHNVETIGGLVFAELGRPPVVGDEIQLSGATLRVDQVEGLGIRQVSLLFSPPDGLGE